HQEDQDTSTPLTLRCIGFAAVNSIPESLDGCQSGAAYFVFGGAASRYSGSCSLSTSRACFCCPIRDYAERTLLARRRRFGFSYIRSDERMIAHNVLYAE